MAERSEIRMYLGPRRAFHGSDEAARQDDLARFDALPVLRHAAGQPDDGFDRIIQHTGAKPGFLDLAVA